MPPNSPVRVRPSDSIQFGSDKKVPKYINAFIFYLSTVAVSNSSKPMKNLSLGCQNHMLQNVILHCICGDLCYYCLLFNQCNRVLKLVSNNAGALPCESKKGLAGTEQKGGPVVTKHSVRNYQKEIAVGLLNLEKDAVVQITTYSCLEYMAKEKLSMEISEQFLRNLFLIRPHNWIDVKRISYNLRESVMFVQYSRQL